jgi:hypothetical protein
VCVYISRHACHICCWFILQKYIKKNQPQFGLCEQLASPGVAVSIYDAVLEKIKVLLPPMAVNCFYVVSNCWTKQSLVAANGCKLFLSCCLIDGGGGGGGSGSFS